MMPVNPSTLTTQEQEVLTNWNSGSEILAVKKDGRTLVRLPKTSVTCWQLFLRFFGKGQLAAYDLHLKAVAAHLNGYDWKGIAPESTLYNCYLNVCVIANKAIFKKATALYENVSQERQNIEGEMRQTADGKTMHFQLPVHLNPALQGRHILALVQQKCRYGGHYSLMSADNKVIADCHVKVLSAEDMQNYKIHIAVVTQYTNFPHEAFRD